MRVGCIFNRQDPNNGPLINRAILNKHYLWSGIQMEASIQIMDSASAIQMVILIANF